MTGASFETLDPQATKGPWASHQGVVSVVIDHNDITQPLRGSSPLQRQGRGNITPIPDGCASPPGSAAAEAPWVPGVFRPHPPRVFPEGSTIIHILGAVTTMPHHPSREQGWVRSTCQGDAAGLWCASSTGMAPVAGQILLVGKGCRTLVCE